MLSTAFSNRVLCLLPLLLGWQAWRVCGGNTRGQWSLSGVLSGLLVFPTTTNCILTVGFPFPYHFFSYGRRKIFISHLHLQIQPVFQEISEQCIFIPKSWQQYLEFKPSDFQFLSVLVPSCRMYWDVLLFCLHAYIHTFDFQREKGILDTCLEVLGMWGCIALSWNE